jgi:citrate (Re)-synthase
MYGVAWDTMIFHLAVDNSTTAWLYGVSSVNTTLFGIGERTGNCPMEAMLFQYAQIKGTIKNMNFEIITELANYFKNQIGYDINPKMPFVGSQFNVTKAGIHADGMLKDEEIYNAFNTKKILGRPVVIEINQYSGLAGIAAWINSYYRLKGDNKVGKKDSGILEIKKWIDNQYKMGRTSIIRNNEMELLVKKFMPEVLEKREERAC